MIQECLNCLFALAHNVGNYPESFFSNTSVTVVDVGIDCVEEFEVGYFKSDIVVGYDKVSKSSKSAYAFNFIFAG